MKSIVIVEDDVDLQFIFKSVLRRAGFDVKILSDGRSLPDYSMLPDLFIFDIELPFITGLSLCKKVKVDPATRHIPVMIASASAELLVQANEACADEVLEKPFDPKVLVAKVRSLLGDQ